MRSGNVHLVGNLSLSGKDNEESKKIFSKVLVVVNTTSRCRVK